MLENVSTRILLENVSKISKCCCEYRACGKMMFLIASKYIFVSTLSTLHKRQGKHSLISIYWQVRVIKGFEWWCAPPWSNRFGGVPLWRKDATQAGRVKRILLTLPRWQQEHYLAWRGSRESSHDCQIAVAGRHGEEGEEGEEWEGEEAAQAVQASLLAQLSWYKYRHKYRYKCRHKSWYKYRHKSWYKYRYKCKHKYRYKYRHKYRYKHRQKYIYKYSP